MADSLRRPRDESAFRLRNDAVAISVAGLPCLRDDVLVGILRSFLFFPHEETFESLAFVLDRS